MPKSISRSWCCSAAWAARLLGFGLILGAAPGLAAGQSVTYLKYSPAVIPEGATSPVLLEVELSAVPTRANLEFQPLGSATTILELNDAGSDGDRVAGDRTYSVRLPVAPIQNALRADDVHRVFIGFLNLFNGATNVFRGNLFVDVYASSAGTVPVVRLSQFVQATSRIVNIHDPTYFLSPDPSRVTQEFYRWFGDDYDVINLVYDPQRFQNRTHSVIRNAVSGIGLSLSNNSGRYGSAGRLTGISQFPIARLFDGAETAHIHELGHQWINFLNFPPLAEGIPHWPKSTMAGGVMGFSIGGQGGQGGSFACDIVEVNGQIVLNPRPDAPAYGDLDLYLMGLLPADQVRTQIVFADQAAVAQLVCAGQVFTGPVIRLTAQDVIARYGPRTPAAGAAPTRFRIATILVTRDELASPEMMWLYTWFAERGELTTRVPTHSGFSKQLGRPFFLATGGRGSLDMTVGVPAFLLIPTPASRTVTSGSPASFTVSIMPGGTSFEGSVRLSCGTLPANASCAFSPAEVVPGPNWRDVILTVATRAAAPALDALLGGPPGVWWVWAAGFGLGAAVLMRGSRRRDRLRVAHAAILCTVVWTLGFGACGKPKPPPENTNTPPGTYAISVIGTSGAAQNTTSITLVVQ